MKIKWNLLERLDKSDLPFFFFPVEIGVGNIVIEDLDRVVEI